MTEQEQRIAIAEACKRDEWVIVKRGLYYCPNAGGYTHSIARAWKLPKAEAKRYEMYADRSDVDQCEKVLIEPAPPPDYLHDLNACHEMEKTLVNTFQYQLWLDRLTNRNEWHATAAQRCEAFLRTIGKWKEPPAAKPPPTLRCPRCDAEIDFTSVDEGWTGCPSCKWDGPVEEANKA